MDSYERTYVDAAGFEHRYPMHRHGHGDEIECMYCGAIVTGCEECPNAPPADDDEAWAEIAAEHATDCPWAISRAHQVD